MQISNGKLDNNMASVLMKNSVVAQSPDAPPTRGWGDPLSSKLRYRNFIKNSPESLFNLQDTTFNQGNYRIPQPY